MLLVGLRSNRCGATLDQHARVWHLVLGLLAPARSKKIQNTYSFVAVMALNFWFAAGPVHV
jgi:hypothetical protein